MEMNHYWFIQITIILVLLLTFFFTKVFLLVVSIYILIALVGVVHQLQLLRYELREKRGKK